MAQDSNNLEMESLEVLPRASDKITNSIYVRNAYKHYGTKKNPFHVLNGLNMTLPRGCIYGLLGASGCGKTTLLNCIVGRRKLDSGDVWVLGSTPGTKDCEVLGNRLGYMPQEMALYGEFSIKETIQFYGWVAGMKSKKIKERTEFLVKVLMLPKPTQRVDQLSTGQRRRVSLAAALVHEPELLILDEPTVGVDPVLRQIIWDHFLDIISNGRTSIVITTHYIDETRQANLIGLMRKGVLLAEQNPEQLISQFNAATLEEVFLKLSIVQNLERGKKSVNPKPSTSLATTSQINKSIGVTSAEIEEFKEELENVSLYKYRYDQDPICDETSIVSPQKIPSKKENFVAQAYSYYRMSLKYDHIKAIMWKNYLWATSHYILLVFGIIMPMLQIYLFFTCIGGFPKDLRIATVNYESNNDPECNTTLYCTSPRLSCAYFAYLEKRGLNLIYYDTEDEAVNSVMKSKTYASMVVYKNYSESLKIRILKFGRTRDWDIKYAAVHVYRDVADKAIANFLLFYLYDSFFYFMKDFLKSCGWTERTLALPIDVVDPPVYGQRYPNFNDFVLPGAIITISFIAGVGLTAGAMLVERSEGNLERYFVTGITGLELLAAHGASQIAAIIYEMAVTMITAFVILDLTCKGSYILVIVLQMLVSFCGMCFGLIISTFCRTEQTALQVAMGSLIPIIGLGGIAWPVEAMHDWLKPFTYFLPLTQSSEAMRSLLHRGLPFSNVNIYMGFVSIILWIGIFLTACVLIIRYRKNAF